MVRSPPPPRGSILPLCSSARSASPSVAETHQENGRIAGSATEARAYTDRSRRRFPALRRPAAARLREETPLMGRKRGGAGTSNLRLLNMNNYNGKKIHAVSL